MSNQAQVVTSGVVAFSNITEFDSYNGKSTGKYSLTVTLDPAEASKLADMGVRVKQYVPKDENGEPQPEKAKDQRKFTSQYHVPVVDMDDHQVQGEIPFGSKVRVLWKGMDAHPEYGVPTYVNRVRVVEMAEGAADDTPEEF